MITGGSGLLGVNWAWTRRKDDDTWIGLHKRQIHLDGVRECNLFDTNSLEKTIKTLAPNVIIHTAGITNIDACEQTPTQALKVNRDLAKKFAKIAFSHNITFVHISTDHLFEGRLGMLDEEAIRLPLNIYGQSKFLGESAVLAANPKALVLRVNFFGWGPHYRLSFSDWILTSLASGTLITLYDNVYFTPLYTGQIITYAHRLIEQNATGIYHITSSDRLSKFDFGMKLANAFGYNKKLITRGAYNPNKGTPRPLDMSLSNVKLQRTIGPLNLTTDSAIEALKTDVGLHSIFSSIDFKNKKEVF